MNPVPPAILHRFDPLTGPGWRAVDPSAVYGRVWAEAGSP